MSPWDAIVRGATRFELVAVGYVEKVPIDRRIKVRRRKGWVLQVKYCGLDGAGKTKV